jgi:Gas vesicle synthesis protein GvpL/GvpF
MSRGLCAYAITRAHEPGPPDVRLVTHRGLALVVAEVDLAPFVELEENPARLAREPSEDDPLVVLARRHDTVVRTVFEHHPVLPLRFGTILRDEQAAVRLLTDHHDEAGEGLGRVDGHREWGVRARLPHPGKPAEVSTEGMSGTDYLTMRRDRLAAAARTRRGGGAAATSLHEALSRHAKETTQRPRKSSAPLLDAAYLVATEAEPAFHAEAERHGELAVEVTGPWPPYSFVRLELAAEAVTHA